MAAQYAGTARSLKLQRTYDMPRCARRAGSNGACVRRGGGAPPAGQACHLQGRLAVAGWSSVEMRQAFTGGRLLPAGESLRDYLQKVLGLAHHAHPRPTISDGSMIFHLLGKRESSRIAVMAAAWRLGIDDEPFEIRVIDQYLEQFFPKPFVSPADETVMYGTPFPVFYRQVPPGGACP